MHTKVDGQTVNLLPDIRMRECLNDLESRVRDEWVIVDESGLAGKYPVGTKKHIGWETVQDGEVHLRGVEAICSRDLDLNQRVLESRPVKDTGEIKIVNDRGRDL